MTLAPADFDTHRTRDGYRLSQHGVVLSELRVSPGPTHSVFDVLAALVHVLKPEARRIGVLGFAGGSVMAPLSALAVRGTVESVDLEGGGYELFQRHCAAWSGPVQWEQADAVDWLRRRPAGFDVLVDDLSIPADGDVIKPGVSWTELPELIRRRLAPDGVAIFNLLKPPRGTWRAGLDCVVPLYPRAALVHLHAFENRILVGGDSLPDTRTLGARLRSALSGLRSRQAGRFHLRTLR